MFKSFVYGLQFQIGELKYEILHRRDTDFEVLNIQSNEKELMSIYTLLEAYNEPDMKKRLFFHMDEIEQPGIEFDLQECTATEILIMNQRFQVIHPFITGELPASKIPQYIENYPDHLKPNGKLSIASFYRWTKAWWKREYKMDLIPHKKGPRHRRISNDESIEILKIIRQYESKPETLSVRDQYHILQSYIQEANALRDPDQYLKIPSESTFRRMYKEHVDTYKKDKELLGLANANLIHFGVRTPQRATRPLEVLELDWTPVDCLIVDFDLEEAYRPVFMYGIDQATNEPMGFHLVMKKEPDAGDWKQLILHCMLPKTNIKKLYPRVQHDWTAYGIPQAILLDNAKINDSNEVAEVCNLLGIGLRYAAVKSGHQKGKVEQALGNINHKAFQGLVGSLFSNTQEKGEYNSASKATVSIQSLYHIAHIVIIDMVANNYNRGEGVHGVPEQRWKQGLEEMRVHPKLPHQKEYLELIFSTTSVTRVIVSRGIELMGHFFYSEELYQLKRRLEREGKSRKVNVRFGSDVRVIYVRDDYKKKYIQAFIKEGNLSSHDLDNTYPIRAELLHFQSRKRNVEFEQFDTTHLGYARRAIEEIQYEDKKNYKKAKSLNQLKKVAGMKIADILAGIPPDEIPSVPEQIIISNVGEEPSTRSSTLPTSPPVTAIYSQPELEIDDINLEEIAASWDIGKKGGK